MNDSTTPVQAGQLDSAKDPILDVRTGAHGSQIRGALRYDPKQLLAADKLLLPLPHDGIVAVYGDSASTVSAVVQRLRAAGFNASALEGGMDAWVAAGLPVEELTQEQPIPGEPSAGIGLL